VILHLETNPSIILKIRRVIVCLTPALPLSMSASPADSAWSYPSWWTAAVLAISVVLWVLYLRKSDGKKKSLYGLQHGRLHLDAQVPMWMNMGYWKVRKPPSQFFKRGCVDET
jgi:hypothetical protein